MKFMYIIKYNIQHSDFVQNLAHKAEEGINVIVEKAKQVNSKLMKQVLNTEEEQENSIDNNINKHNLNSNINVEINQNYNYNNNNSIKNTSNSETIQHLESKLKVQEDMSPMTDINSEIKEIKVVEEEVAANK